MYIYIYIYIYIYVYIFHVLFHLVTEKIKCHLPSFDWSRKIKFNFLSPQKTVV